MCTVSYIPGKNKTDFILTSNRDEKAHRETLSPQEYEINGVKLCFPMDVKAGGSWIASNNNGRLCCLLNGAYIAHKKQDFHTESRGKVLIEVSSFSGSPSEYFINKNLQNVEPFTLITLEYNGKGISCFNEFVWDGNTLNYRDLNVKISYIWSSVTLYSYENRELRKQWFQQFLNGVNGSISSEKVFSFHSGNHTNDTSVNVIMEREGGLKTVSITQVVPEKGQLKMHYSDLLENAEIDCVL